MIELYKLKALENLRADCAWVIREGELEWLDEKQTAPTEAEIQAEIDRLEAAQPMVELREERNRRLAETDYLALPDVPMSSEMTTYRQALRDLPANTTDPANPVWPTKPEA